MQLAELTAAATCAEGEEGFFGAIDVKTGRSILFIPKLPQEYGVWMGPINGLDFYQAKYAVDQASPPPFPHSCPFTGNEAVLSGAARWRPTHPCIHGVLNHR